MSTKRSSSPAKQIPLNVEVVGETDSTSTIEVPPSAPTPRKSQKLAYPLNYDQFLAERNRYIDARQRSQQRFDQLVTTGAGGALILSITFLDNIAGRPELWTKPVLFASWTLLIVALGTSLVLHYFSQKAFDAYVDALDEATRTQQPAPIKGTVAHWIQRLEVASSIALVLGVLLLAIFAFVNLSFRG